MKYPFKNTFLKLSLGCLLFIGNLNILNAQNDLPDRPGIFFKEKDHDFGELRESQKFATHRFEFFNKTSRPIIVNRVESSCGCTAPSWSSDPVPPGQTGFIEARYETTNRPGKFDKTLTVYTNSPEALISYLSIRGNVVKDPVITNNYPMPSVGRLEFDKYQISFEPLYDHQSAMKEIRVINQSSYATNLYLAFPDKIPSYAQIQYPKILEPGEIARVQVSIDGKKAPGYGFGSFEVVLQSNAPGTPSTAFQVNYTRVQYFPELTKNQLKKAPKMEVAQPVYDFGKQEHSGGFLEGSFTLKNTGKQPLSIKQINPDCPCISLINPPETIAPGKSALMKFRFDTVTKTGAKSIGIRMVSNDPTEPERYFWVKAEFPEKYQYKCPTCP
jgi:hypothetical protein